MISANLNGFTLNSVTRCSGCNQRSQYAGKGLALQRLERGESPDSFLAKGVQSIVIDEERAAGHHYFFLKNVALIDPIVSSELVHAIRDRVLNVPLESLST